MSRFAPFALLCTLLCLPHPSRAQDVTPAKTPQGTESSDPHVAAALEEGKQLSRRHQYAFAADSYKKANKLAGGHCLLCLLGAYNAESAVGNYKDAQAAAVAMEEIVTTPAMKSAAEAREAAALYNSAGKKPKPEKLAAVHSLLQKALIDAPRNASALFLDGKVLAQLNRINEAKAAFAKCVQCVGPEDPGRLRATHFAENPELSLQQMAPAFEVTAADGSRFNLDAMGGRVVLIDFWATWCGPCNREIPHMQAIAKEFAGQPLVMISVSVDQDEARWKDFVAKHNMTWVQYRDADHKLSDEFEVTTIPRYFTIDADGVLTSVMVDEGSDVEGKLKKLLAKAREAQKPAMASAAPVPAQAADQASR